MKGDHMATDPTNPSPRDLPLSNQTRLSDPEIFYPALADRWLTAFQRVGAEPWVIHGPGPLRPGPQRTGTKSASWKAEGTAVPSRYARRRASRRCAICSFTSV